MLMPYLRPSSLGVSIQMLAQCGVALSAGSRGLCSGTAALLLL